MFRCPQVYISVRESLLEYTQPILLACIEVNYPQTFLHTLFFISLDNQASRTSNNGFKEPKGTGST
jgi:hypothetical protein